MSVEVFYDTLYSDVRKTLEYGKLYQLMLNFYLSLTNRNMATRRNVPNKGIDGGRILVPYANGSRFFAPLTDSVVPNRSIWPITFSRSSGATVLDHEWVVRYAKSGEARFQGARRVENLHTYSEDITNAVWNKASCTSAKNAWIAPDGTNTAWLVTSNVATVLTEFFQNYNIVGGQTYILSVSLKANGWLQYVQLLWNGATFWAWYIDIDLSNGTITANVPWTANMQATVTPEANWFYRIQLKATAIANLANNHLSVAMIPSSSSIRLATFPWDGIKWFYYWHPQFEDVTGQSIQTAGEYVSTNVLTGAPFHGAMVDGVKYFDTDLSGNQLSPDGYLSEWQKTNLFTDSEDFSLWTKAGTWVITPNATIAPDGRMTADLFTLSTANEWQSVNKTITTTASIYGYSVFVKPNGHNYVQLLASAGINSGYMNFDLLNGVVWTSSSYTGRIEALPNGWYRIKITTGTVLAATGQFIIAAVPSASASRGGFVKGTGTSWVYLWWAQLEVWATSSYISSTLGTRNDDILEYSLVNLQSTKWSVYAETTNYFTSNNVALLWLTGGSCRVLWSSGTAPWFIRSGTQVIVNDGSNNLTSSNTVSASQYDRALWKYSWSAQEICLNGTLTSGTFDGTTSFTNLYIGNAWVSRALYGSIRNLQIWDYEISDAEAVALTTI